MANYPEFVSAAITAAEATPSHKAGDAYFTASVEANSYCGAPSSSEQIRVYTKFIPAGDEPAAPKADAVRSWVVTDRAFWSPDDQSSVGRRVTAYSVFIPAPGVPANADICGYCGFRNDCPDGCSSRIGYNCGMCGGN